MDVIYEFACSAAFHSIECFYKMGDAPDTIPCDDHDAIARRKLSRGNFATVPGGYNSTRSERAAS